ncbi:cerebral cavernous malformations protein 2 homolog isoform X2 [Gigantopelta aegis]|uniref:cerebral cavernous malformations protein 2 homolog isoform X2 n=1 Tax=Gigantopelta aegis TaxID=1735272 RepID=UPI001B88CA37|nr:cerebral cavernous malformations protein 2 homolog isoform X2 [Gigantopelta aegis]
MDEDPRSKRKTIFHPIKSSKVGRPEPSMYDRRTLKSYDLKPPDYYIKPHILIEENVEKIVLYVGIIEAVPVDIDTTNRTTVLRIIDEGKKKHFIPHHVGYDNQAIFSISVYNVKISRYNATEDLLVRIPIHEIATTCYIKDDGQHILAIKHGTTENCNLTVLYCDNKQTVEEICALFSQCFQLVYTDATLQWLDNKIDASSLTNSTGSSTNRIEKPRLSFMTDSDIDLPSSPYNPPLRIRPTDRPDSIGRSTRGSDVSLAKELLKETVNKIHHCLSSDELSRFAKLLSVMHNEMPFLDFCEKMRELFGSDRKYMLAELSPFIPAEHYQEFEDYLQQQGIPLPGNVSTISSTRSNHGYTRSVSEMSNASTISNGDHQSSQAIDYITDLINNMNASVSVNTNPDSHMP